MSQTTYSTTDALKDIAGALDVMYRDGHSQYWVLKRAFYALRQAIPDECSTCGAATCRGVKLVSVCADCKTPEISVVDCEELQQQSYTAGMEEAATLVDGYQDLYREMIALCEAGVHPRSDIPDYEIREVLARRIARDIRARCHPDTNLCPDPECTYCGQRDCPNGEPLHYHHDGCPVCIPGASINVQHT